MRIFTLPPAAETPPEPNFYDSVKKIRLRQQLEMYSIGKSKEREGSPGPVGYWGRFLREWHLACLSSCGGDTVALCEQRFCGSAGHRIEA